MKLISYNVNGIRAAMNKGFMEWLETEMPDVIMTACKGKESGKVAHEGSFTTWFKGEYLTAWRQCTQSFAAEMLTPADGVQLLQDTFDEINASK